MITTLRHGVGSVIQGQVVKHTFRLRNPFDEPLHVIGLEKSCGCADVSLSAKQIHTAADLQANITLDTAKTTGAFAHGVTLRCRSDSGVLREYRLTLDGTALTQVFFSPEIVQVSGTESSASVKVEARVPVDWSTLRVSVSSVRASVVVLKAEGSVAELQVRGSPPPGVPRLFAELQLTIKTIHDGVTSLRTFSLPVYFVQEVELAIHPQEFVLSAEMPTQSSSLVLSGRNINRMKGIPKCMCNGYDVKAQLKRDPSVGPNPVALWELTFARAVRDPPEATLLEIFFQGCDPLRVPVLVLRSGVNFRPAK